MCAAQTEPLITPAGRDTPPPCDVMNKFEVLGIVGEGGWLTLLTLKVNNSECVCVCVFVWVLMGGVWLPFGTGGVPGKHRNPAVECGPMHSAPTSGNTTYLLTTDKHRQIWHTGSDVGVFQGLTERCATLP